MMICPVGAELFHADGRTNRQERHDETKLALRNFANSPNMYNFPLVHKSMKFGFLLCTT
jgi:hypothetical protein